MARARPSVKDSIRQFFRGNTSSVAASTKEHGKGPQFFVTLPILKDLSPETPVNQRLKTLKDLRDIVVTKRLEDNAIESIWAKINDLLEPHVLTEHREIVLNFLKCLVSGQYEYLGIMRGRFFEVIEAYQCKEDLLLLLELFKALSSNGKDLQYFQEKTAPLMLKWIPDFVKLDRLSDFLPLLVNVLKFNSSFMDEETISEIVTYTCRICQRSVRINDVELCLQVLETVICYHYLPVTSLPEFTAALCHTVNTERLCQPSWKLMRNLLGTHLGYSGIYNLCSILENRDNVAQPELLRGAVFFIGMALWGSKRVTSLKHTPNSVLPSFLKALESQHPKVAYEVVLCTHRVVKKYHQRITGPTWDLILEVTQKLILNLEKYTPRAEIAPEVHSLLDTIEELYERNVFGGCNESLFQIIEQSRDIRPESSVLRLIAYKAQAISPITKGWIQNLTQLMNNYYKKENRTNIRMRALNVLSCVLSSTRHIYEDDLIEIVVLPQLANVADDRDKEVRHAVIQLLLDVAQDCSSNKCLEVLDLVVKVLNYPLELPEGHLGKGEATSPEDIQNAVNGLLEFFKVKLYLLPSSHAIKAFELFNKHLQSHYINDCQSEIASNIRYSIFHCMLNLRADHLHRIGVPDKDGVIKYSPYLLCDVSPEESAMPSQSTGTSSAATPPFALPTHTTSLPFKEGFVSLILCFKQERDWRVLEKALSETAKGLHNKDLLLSAGANLNRLAYRLCRMVLDRPVIERLYNIPPGFTHSNLKNAIFPVLSMLSSYSSHLEPSIQTQMINCLDSGLNLQCAQQCVSALMTCMIEMQPAMTKLIGSVLLHLSQISATVAVAMPVLEFLSNLIRLPKLFSNFNEDMFMSIFAIALPYTNPFKFSLYTVALAHHVIIMWFIKCPLLYKRDFVGFITKSFQSNSIPESLLGHRKLHRTSSVSEKKSAKKPSEGGKNQKKAVTSTDTRSKLHTELTETCIDILSRYAFSSMAALPKRTPIAEYLLTGGQSKTWLLGNKLVTITTSGSGNRVKKNGLCERCNNWLFGEPGLGQAEPQQGAAAAATFSPEPQQRPVLSPEQPVVGAAADPEADGDVFCPAVDSKRPIPPVVRHKLAHRQRSKSGNTYRTDSAGNLLPLKPTPREDAAELKHLSLITTATAPATPGTGVTAPRPPPRKEERPGAVGGARGGRGQGSEGDWNPLMCNCWARSWAEVLVRGPSGNTSWMVRLQNHTELLPDYHHPPLSEVTDLLLAADMAAQMAAQSEGKKSSTPVTSGPPSPRLPSPISSSTFSAGDSSFLSDAATSLIRSPVDAEFNESGGLSPDAKYSKPVLGASPIEMSALLQDYKLYAQTLKREHTTSESEKFLKDTAGETASSLLRGRDCSVLPTTLKKSSSSPDLSTSPLVQLQKMMTSSCQAQATRDQEDADTISLPHSTGGGNESEVERTSEMLKDYINVELEGDTTAVVNGQRMGLGDLAPQPLITTMPPPLPREEERRGSGGDSAGAGPEGRRPRGNTVSVVEPAKENSKSERWTSDVMENRRRRASSVRDEYRGGVNPSFVFLQLYQSAVFGERKERPLLLPDTQVIERAVKNLDRITPYETHKIGVLYVDVGQAKNEAEILSNKHGSFRYTKFISGLGKLIELADAKKEEVYLGGLHTTGEDGKFAYSWQDNVMQVIFHVATMMPTKDSDSQCNNKKLHIGNDHVSIVYNDSLQAYTQGVIKGQFNFVEIVIQPLDNNSNLVTVQMREEIRSQVGSHGPTIVSDAHLALVTRQLAVHSNLASRVQHSLSQGAETDAYLSNWLERLRQIKRIRKKAQAELQAEALATSPRRFTRQTSIFEDFTDYV